MFLTLTISIIITLILILIITFALIVSQVLRDSTTQNPKREVLQIVLNERPQIQASMDQMQQQIGGGEMMPRGGVPLPEDRGS